MEKMKYEDYRQQIYILDTRIANTNDPEEKKTLIDQDIALNRQYIHALKKPLPAKIVLCIILSFAFLIGLMIFLPQIIIRNNRINACERRIVALQEVKRCL